MNLLCLPSNRAFLAYTLHKFAALNPSIEINVSPRPNKPPLIRAAYVNGAEKVTTCSRLEKEQILAKAERMRDASGRKAEKFSKPVRSKNLSVRGIWDPFHPR